MSKIWILAVPFVAIVGCRKGEQQFEQPDYPQPTAPAPTTPPEEAQPPVGWEPLEPQQDPAQPGMDETAQAPDFSETLGRLRTYAQEIRATQDLQHRDVVEAINTLAEAIRTMPNAQNTDVTGITTYAERLAASDPMSPEHANLTKNALMESLRTLETLMQQQNVTGMDERLTQIRTQVEGIQDETPLLEQKDAIANALDQMAQVMDDLQQQPPTGTQ